MQRLEFDKITHHILNKGVNSKFTKSYLDQQTFEEGWISQYLKHSDNSKKVDRC